MNVELYGLNEDALKLIEGFKRDDEPYVTWRIYGVRIALYMHTDGTKVYYEVVEAVVNVDSENAEIYVCLAKNIEVTAEFEGSWGAWKFINDDSGFKIGLN